MRTRRQPWGLPAKSSRRGQLETARRKNLDAHYAPQILSLQERSGQLFLAVIKGLLLFSGGAAIGLLGLSATSVPDPTSLARAVKYFVGSGMFALLAALFMYCEQFVTKVDLEDRWTRERQGIQVSQPKTTPSKFAILCMTCGWIFLLLSFSSFGTAATEAYTQLRQPAPVVSQAEEPTAPVASLTKGTMEPPRTETQTKP